MRIFYCAFKVLDPLSICWHLHGEVGKVFFAPLGFYFLQHRIYMKSFSKTKCHKPDSEVNIFRFKFFFWNSDNGKLKGGFTSLDVLIDSFLVGKCFALK